MALLIGVVAGLRSLTAPAVVAWAAFLGWINLHGTWASWVANIITVVSRDHPRRRRTGHRQTSQDPGRAPRRRRSPPGSCWAHSPARSSARRGTRPSAALGAGVIGAVLGTLGGYQARQRLVAARDGHDLPIALLEDAVAILGGFAILALTASL